jgi:hypothetical protein
MAHNIRFTDHYGEEQFIFYHNILGYLYEAGVAPDPESESLGREAVCTVYFRESWKSGGQDDYVWEAKVTGPKANLLKTAIENGVIDLDEGDFVAQSLPTDFLQPSPNQVFLQASGSTMTVFHNPCVRMAQVDQIVYGYYLEQDGSITVDEVYVDDTGEWTSTTTSDEIATPLLYCEKPVPPSPSVEALRAASDLQDQTTM